MAVVSCPKCTAGLRVPDGSAAAVRCPKCKTVFQPAAPKPKAAAPAFEVVEDAPPKPAPRPTPPPAAPPQKKAFSLDDAVRSADREPRRDDDRDRRRRDEDDDEDDRPRGRSRRDRDEAYDDRDRRRDDRDDRDDDRDREPDRPRKKSKFGIARPAVLLLLISLGLYFGGMALHVLFLFLAWVGVVIPGGLVVVTGVLGLGGWVVGLVGLGMAIAGPAKARGLAIAATAVAAVHLVLAFVVATNQESALYGDNTVQMLSVSNRFERSVELEKEYVREMEKNPTSARAKQLRDDLDGASRRRGGAVVITEDDFGFGSGMRWGDLLTDLTRLDKLIAILVYQSRGFEYYLWSLFAGLAELARLILLGLLLGALARAAKDHRAEDQSKFGWIAGAAAVGINVLVVLLAALVVESMAKNAVRQGGSGSGVKHLLVLGELFVYVLHAGALVLPGLATLGVFQSMGRRLR